MSLAKSVSRQAFQIGFDTVFANLRFFLTLALGLASLTLFSATASYGIFYATESQLLSSIVSTVIFSAVFFVLFKASLHFLDHGKLDASLVFGQTDLFLKYMIASLLFWIAVYAGLALLILPGIYILLTYGFYPLEMLDRNLGPIEALKRSAMITKGSKLSLLRLGAEFYCGLTAINALLLILVISPAILLFALAVMLEGWHVMALSTSISYISGLASALVLAVPLLDVIIIIPAYAIAIAYVYRSLEPLPYSSSEAAPSRPNKWKRLDHTENADEIYLTGDGKGNSDTDTDTRDKM